MAPIDILRDWKNSNPNIQNIMIFVSDALRWDCLPQSVAQQGITFKTIASSLFTACSFPSMATGLYPPNHGVYSWRVGKLSSNLTSLMNLDGYNSSLWNENTWIRYDPPESTPIHQVLRQKKRIPLDEIEPPFIYLEDEKGGHAPFGWTSGDKEYEEWEAVKFFRDYGGKDKTELVERYRKGVVRSAEMFEKRLDTLRNRRLIDKTLVIFTSDHGEALGEHGGHVGHGRIACPEVVYVPTVLIHPTLPSGISFANKGVMRHVDLYPTILDILHIELPYPVDGISFFTASKIPQIGCNYLEVRLSKKWLKTAVGYRHKEISVWDKDGGYIFRDSNFFTRLLHSIRTLSIGTTSNYLRGYLQKKGISKAFKAYSEVLKYYISPYIKHGSPSFDKEDAIIIAKRLKRGETERIKRSVQQLRRENKI